MPSAHTSGLRDAAAKTRVPGLADPLNPLAAEVGKALAQEMSKYSIHPAKSGRAKGVAPLVPTKAELGSRITSLVAHVLEESLSAPTAKGKALRMALIAKLASSEMGGERNFLARATVRDALLTTAEAAARLEVSRPYISMLCDAGKLGEVVLTEGGHRRVRASAVESYLATRIQSLEGAGLPREAGVEAGLYELEDGAFQNVVRESVAEPKAKATQPARPAAKRTAVKLRP